MDYVQVLLNQGLYEFRIFDSIPDWSANEGENGIYITGVNRFLYMYINGGWTALGFNPGGTLVLFDADGDTGITPENATDEDIIRFFIATSEKMQLNATTLEVGVNIDFNQHEMVAMRIENRTSDPGSPAVGEIWIRTDV